MADENEDVRIKDLTDIKYEGFLPLDDENGTGKFRFRTLLENIAPVFSNIDSYKKGDYVLYHNILYRYKTDHDAGGWVQSEAEFVSIGQLLNVIDSIVGKFSVVENEEYLFSLADSKGRVVFAIKKDGTIDRVSDDILKLFRISETKVDKVDGKSLVDSTFASGIKIESNND